ncbi:MAG: alanine racemase [Patescibacteria group bacterium]
MTQHNKENLSSVWCEIQLANISHNVDVIKKNIGKTKLMAVLKSNAYGHGLVAVGLHLDTKKEVDYFGVYTVEEGVALRVAGVTKRIVVLGPIFNEGDYQLIHDHSLEFMLMGMDEMSALVAHSHLKFKVHIKIDTGLHRFGFDPSEMAQVIMLLENNTHIIPVGVASHLASLEDGMLDYTHKQITLFTQSVRMLQSHGFALIKHIGAASSLLSIPEAHFDMVRVGISLYGLWPTDEMQKKYSNKLDLRAALSFKTRIAYRKRIEAGDFIGYGGTFKADTKMTIGILPVGYYEGLDRRLSNIGEVLVGGKRVKIIGRIGMNTAIIDLTDVPAVRVGDEVVLIGEDGSGNTISAEEMAGLIGTVPHEITTARIPDFVPRIYLG